MNIEDRQCDYYEWIVKRREIVLIKHLLDLSPLEYAKKIESYIITMLKILFVVLLIGSVGLYYYGCRDLKSYFNLATLSLGIMGCGSLFILVMQSVLVRVHAENNYAIGRSQKAIDLVSKWSLELGAEALLARRIVDRLNMESCRDLANYHPVKVCTEDYLALKSFLTKDYGLSKNNLNEPAKKSSEPQQDHIHDTVFCPNYSTCGEKDLRLLSLAETIVIRSLVVKYLNTLEVVLIAWHCNVVDQEIIEGQFEYLVSSQDGTVVLENFRKAQGVSNYPGIESFCEFVRTKNKKVPIKPLKTSA